MAGFFGGSLGAPSAFTSPGADPQTLAMLLRMQNAGGIGGTAAAAPAGGAAPQIPGVPAKAPGIPMQPALPAPGPSQQGAGMLGALAGIDPSKIMGMLGLGGATSPGAAPGLGLAPTVAASQGAGAALNPAQMASMNASGGGFPINNWLMFGGGGNAIGL